MVCYQVLCFNNEGVGGNGAMYFATKAEAKAFIKEHGSDSEINRISVKNRDQLVYYLNDAMGYGAT